MDNMNKTNISFNIFDKNLSNSVFFNKIILLINNKNIRKKQKKIIFFYLQYNIYKHNIIIKV